ncbi:MAG: ABC transporter ATP-binding protein, partial [Winogradskyella arenosi]
RNLENLREAEKRTVIADKPKESNKQSYEDQKKLKSLNNKLSNIESKINQLEKELKADDVKLATDYDKTASDPKFFDEYQGKKKKLEQLMSDWEVVQEDLDRLS